LEKLLTERSKSKSMEVECALNKEADVVKHSLEVLNYANLVIVTGLMAAFGIKKNRQTP